MTEAYHETRFVSDPKRTTVWRALWKHFFRHRIDPSACVLDLGCGYGDFVNSVSARRRLAVDEWDGMPRHLAPGVEGHVGSVTDLDWVNDGEVDFAFASNLFEHLTKEELVATLAALRPKLSRSGVLTILQPNYRYAFREYFDDYTHVSVYTHLSLADLLRAQGWSLLEVRPRFLPLTVKSKLPVSEMLVAAYLLSPWKPMGKQMLLVARPN